jgi:hypothetical protein
MPFQHIKLAPVLGIVLAAVLVQMAAAEPDPPLVLERAIALKKVRGRIDHMAVDLGRNRLFVAELGNDSVDVIDVKSGQTIHRIAGLKVPQGVAYTRQGDLVVIANAGDGSIRLYRASDFAPAGTIALGDDSDNIRVDPRDFRLMVGYGHGGLAVIDPVSRSLVAGIKLAAHPEGFQIDPQSNRVFVNIPDARQIAVIDLEAGRQAATWAVSAARANFPMALDSAAKRLATVFRSPARLILLDMATGAVVANLPTCGDADDIFLDAKRHRYYVSCGEGMVEVFEDSPAGYRSAGRIKTSSGARTSFFAPELDRLFVAARAGMLGSDAAILVFRPVP